MSASTSAAMPACSIETVLSADAIEEERSGRIFTEARAMSEALSALAPRCPPPKKATNPPGHPQPNVNHRHLRFGKHDAQASPNHWNFMPRVRLQPSQSLRAKAVCLLLASASALAFTPVAFAQDAGGLRGGMRLEADATDPVTTGGTPASSETQAAPAYVPVSPGAVPDEPTDTANPPGTLFPQDNGNSAGFGDVPVPSARPPTTARERRAAREGREQPAAPRQNTRAAGSGEPAQIPRQETTGTVRTEAVGPAVRIGVPDDGQRAEAIEALDPRQPEEDPYAPLGIRVGTFILRPTIEQGVTVTSNADYSVEGREAVLSQTTLRLNAISDWTQHSASLDAYGTFRKTLSGYEISEIRAGGLAALNLDITEELRARATLGYERAPETAASPVIIADTVEDPIHQTFTGSLGLEKDVGKARFGITGRVEYDAYGDADLSDGTVLSQEDRNSTLVAVLLRGGYEISPAVTPFAEIEAGHNFYQEEVDASGFRRSSDRIGARAGVELDLSEKLTGEISGGWIREQFEDDRLEPIEGPTLNALLTWSPERETTVDIEAATTVEGTTTADESGSLLHVVRVGIERQVRANLTANAELGIGYRDYTGQDGHDLLYNAELGATWWLNRYAGITGRLRHESQKSNIEGRDFKANSVFLGLKVQR
ncbi:outer membrane beta-barrel protein [Mesorhizobium sp. LHD-90]|uniref:outer membrane beta-barrel protein n=1 Tax=Mesorhizobium sp. LHD-90 TaxID=3071414 RepID=UPI0027DFB0B4|nr:outer membrane beta-barrel protein [Mesorhizobium sp. LHD-90]MDQ6433660.1 outer membrane beta-barrel protein [Mesorhizobium sp. LHD-90]